MVDKTQISTRPPRARECGPWLTPPQGVQTRNALPGASMVVMREGGFDLPI